MANSAVLLDPVDPGGVALGGVHGSHGFVSLSAGKRAVTADTDPRLCRLFGLSDGYWLRAQAAFDIELGQRARPDRATQIRRTPIHSAASTYNVFSASQS